jgi:DNA-binding CsgD family transcriptional regulator/tetratricopeptide (TPR) repeat protein
VPDEVAPRPVGRGFELDRLDALLDGTRHRGWGALLSGAPGIGKSTLLDAACERARDRGYQLVRAEGVEFESQLSYAALNQVLRPLGESVDRLEPDLRGPLRTALGLAPGPGADPLVLGNACLAVLADAAAARPLLVAVDDVHWIDRASALVLGFVVRRVADVRVGLLMTTRPAQATLFSHAVTFEHEIAPLAAEDARRLLRTRFPGLSEAQQARIGTYAEGNPLALVELAAAASSPAGIPVAASPSDRVAGLYSARIAELPGSARRFLLLAALEAAGDPAALRAAAGERWLDDLHTCEAAGLARIDAGTGRVAFGHPLIRSSAITLAATAERRAAHRDLGAALATDPTRQAWHLAAAAVGPDESVAAALDAVGAGAFGRGDAGGAIAAAVRAAELSPRPEDRARRLAKAGWFGAVITHDASAAQRLSATATDRDALYAAATLPHLYLAGHADPDVAHRTLDRALDLEPGPSDAAFGALQAQQILAWFTQRTDIWEAHRRHVERLGAPVTERLAQAFLRGRVAPQLALLPLLDRAIETLDGDDLQALALVPSAQFVDRLPACRGPLWRIVDNAPAAGSSLVAMLALEHLVDDAVVAGRWSEADRLLDRARAVTPDRELLLAVGLRWHEAQLAARRGDRDTVARVSEETLAWSAPFQAPVVELQFRVPRALDHLAHAEWEAAYHELTQVMPPGRPFSEYPLVPALTLDLVEAAVHTGRGAEARTHVAIMEESGCAGLSSRIGLLVAAAGAVAASDEALFDAARAHPGFERWPFERARVELAHGLHLRRARSHVAARRRLESARAGFLRLGATAWADRAADGLRASGHALVRREPGSAALTAQELEIAQLAACGLTNKQIGDRLLLSHRTVATHLYHLFPKLGVTTRAALRDALAGQPAP